MVKKKKTVTVIDSICGSGKTSYIYKYIKKFTHDDNNIKKKNPVKFFIFITPYKDEIDKLKKENNSFIEPINNNKEGKECSKTESLIEIIKKPHCNIVMTHKLFFMSFNLILSYIKKVNFPCEYELIIDESPDIFNIFDFKKGDVDRHKIELELLPINNENDPNISFKRGLDKEKIALCKLKENSSKYFKNGSVFDDFYYACDNSNVYLINNSFFISVISLELIRAFKEVKFLTYMFQGQFNEIYLTSHNIGINYKHIEDYGNRDYQLIDGRLPYSGNDLKQLITIFEPKKTDKNYWYNDIGKKYNLSKTWYEDASNKKKIAKVSEALQGFYRKIKPGASKFYWTTYKDYKRDLENKGYLKESSFCSCSTRATNKYRDRNVCAYMINFYNNRNINNFIDKLATPILFKVNMFSLSALIQWMFRSAIRDGKPIKIYIPSSRMRKLLNSWLDGEFETSNLFDDMDKKVG